MPIFKVKNWINNTEVDAVHGDTFMKKSPVTGMDIYEVVRSKAEDVEGAVHAARNAQESWSSKTVVARGDILRESALILRERKHEIAEIVALETGKSMKDALGETLAAVEMGLFVAGEGRRFYGHTNTSAVDNKMAMTVRQPLGVAGLIIAANTPVANVAWKAYPALLCGNTVVMKASEDTPYTALAFARIFKEAGLPEGVFNLVHGYGTEAGAPIVESPFVDILSFTGSCEVGKYIAKTAGSRLAKVCLELGGKNPLVVCDDADIDKAVNASVLSAFSNAGQRCAAGSRLIVFENVYNQFREKLISAVNDLKVGPTDQDDFGPVINERQLSNMLCSVKRSEEQGAKVIAGGYRLEGAQHKNGYYMAPTVIEGADQNSEISNSELFGPITCLYKVSSLDEAIQLSNHSPFALTASIHTQNTNRAMTFINKVVAGVAVVNGPTYGSEPHMPFGGLKQSGNGMREAGMEALDVYSDWKTIYLNYSPEN